MRQALERLSIGGLGGPEAAPVRRPFRERDNSAPICWLDLISGYPQASNLPLGHAGQR
jgi:hypothetical protein